MPMPLAVFRLAFVVLAVTTAACMAPRDGSSSARELVFVTWTPDAPRVWDEAVRRFEQANPGLRVRREIGAHSSSAFHDLVTQKLKNRDPGVDVYFMDVIWIAEFAAAGWARALDDRIDRAERDAFVRGAIEAATWNGKLYGIPAFVDAGLLYYRKDLLAKYGAAAPETWPDLATIAQRILEGEHGEHPSLIGYSGQFMQYEGLVCNLLELVASNGGRLVDAREGRARLDDPRTLEAIAWARDHLIGSLAPRGVLTYQEPESLAVFLQGDAVFLRDWPYAWQAANDPAQSRVVGRVGMAPLPHFPGGRSSAALGGWYYAVSAFSSRADDAWAFVRFMTSEPIQALLATEGSLTPSRAALYEDRDVLARSPELAAQAAAVRGAVPRPVTAMYPAVSSALQRFASRALTLPDEALRADAIATSAEIDDLLALTR